jgi:hypothetical protein
MYRCWGPEHRYGATYHMVFLPPGFEGQVSTDLKLLHVGGWAGGDLSGTALTQCKQSLSAALLSAQLCHLQNLLQGHVCPPAWLGGLCKGAVAAGVLAQPRERYEHLQAAGGTCRNTEKHTGCLQAQVAAAVAPTQYQ